MDPITIAMLGATALQGFSTLLGGYQQAQQYAAQAQQARIDARDAGIASTEQAEQSQYQLHRTLETINTIANAHGVSADSPSVNAAWDQAITMSDRNEAISRFGDLQREQAYLSQARGYTTAEEWAIPLAGMKAAGQGVSGVNSAFPSWGMSAAGG